MTFDFDPETEGYPRGRRWPGQEPEFLEINGGYLYRPPKAPKVPLLRRVKGKLGALVRKVRRK